MLVQHEDDHITVCHGAVRQCLTWGGRMGDYGWPDREYQVFRCMHCDQTIHQRMKLLTKAILRRLPPLGSTRDKGLVRK